MRTTTKATQKEGTGWTLCTTTVSWAASLLLLTLFQTPPADGDHKPLEGTHWTAIELAGKPTPKQDPKQGAYLQFDASARISGFDGCNRLAGSYQLKGGDSLTFSQRVSTQMACLKSPGIEDAFRDALTKTSRFTLAGDRLELQSRAWDLEITGAQPDRAEPLALTRAMCDPGSMHDQIVARWGSITSYVMKGGHLFLALKLDSSIYEFEPFTPSK